MMRALRCAKLHDSSTFVRAAFMALHVRKRDYFIAITVADMTLLLALLIIVHTSDNLCAISSILWHSTIVTEIVGAAM